MTDQVPIVRYDDEGLLDEVICTNVEAVHFEAMDRGHVNCVIQLRDGRSMYLDFCTQRPAQTKINWTMHKEWR